MKGWLDKLEDGGKFDGLTNEGFNYNGAWGGPAQNGGSTGGSMPGSVGFTYARIGAPSNGKKAKKTLASAEFGTFMKELPKAKVAQKIQVKERATQTTGESTGVGKRTTVPLQAKKQFSTTQLAADKEAANRAAYIARGKKEGSFNQADPQGFWSKTYDIAKNPFTAAELKLRTGHVPDNFVGGMAAGHIQRNIMDYPLDLINPVSKVSMVPDTYNAAKGLIQGDPTAALMMGVGKFKPLQKAIGNIANNPLVKKYTTPAVVTKLATKGVNYARDKAAKFAIEQGKNIYDPSRTANRKGQDGIEVRDQEEENYPMYQDTDREGIQFSPRGFGDFGVSRYGDLSGGIGAGILPDNRYLRADASYNAGDFSASADFRRNLGRRGIDEEGNPFEIPAGNNYRGEASYMTPGGGVEASYERTPDSEDLFHYGLMGNRGNFSGELSVDKDNYGVTPGAGLSYNDRGLRANVNYSGIDNPSIGANIGYNNRRGLDLSARYNYNRDRGSNVNVGARYSFAHGGIIDDDMGQWAHPGEITRINSNNITMRGVNQPLLGISDTGDTQYMTPENNYNFEGNNVTEIPMAQSGTNDFMTQWTNSPMHKQMLQKSEPKNWEEMLENRKENLGNVDIYHEELPEEYDESIGGEADEFGNVYIYDQDPRVQRGMETHEISHVTDSPVFNFTNVVKGALSDYGLADEPTDNLPDSDEALMNKMRAHSFKETPLYEDIRKMYGDNITMKELKKVVKANHYDQDFINYIGQPTETRARLNDLRDRANQQKIYDPFKQKITPAQFKELLENKKLKGGNYNPLEQLRTAYSDEELFKLLNTVSQNEEPQDNTRTAKDGSELTKLNQLTNFTNYNEPQTGGWLDQYANGGPIQDERAQAVTTKDVIKPTVKAPKEVLKTKTVPNKTAALTNAVRNAVKTVTPAEKKNAQAAFDSFKTDGGVGGLVKTQQQLKVQHQETLVKTAANKLVENKKKYASKSNNLDVDKNKIPDKIDAKTLKTPDDVVKVQQNLKRLGYDLDPRNKFKNKGVDGKLGDVTLAAIEEHNKRGEAAEYKYTPFKTGEGYMGKCTETQCSEYTQNEIFRNLKPQVSRPVWNKKIGITGSAWEVGKNIKNAGGREVSISEPKEGNVVTIYTGVQTYMGQAKKAGTDATHIAVIDKVNKDGSYYVVHNVHKKTGKKGKDGKPIYIGREYRTLVQPDGKVQGENMNHYRVRNAYEPNYGAIDDYEKKAKTRDDVNLVMDPAYAKKLQGLDKSTGSVVNKLAGKEIMKPADMQKRVSTYLAPINNTKNKQTLAAKHNLSETDYQTIAQVSMGVLGQESGLGTSIYAPTKEVAATAAHAIGTTVKTLTGTTPKTKLTKYDEVSKGAGRIKYQTNYGKANLSEFGINEDNFTDDDKMPVVVMDIIAGHYKAGIAKGLSKEDAIYAAIEKYNRGSNSKYTKGKDVDYANKVLSIAEGFNPKDKDNVVYNTLVDKLNLDEKLVTSQVLRKDRQK